MKISTSFMCNCGKQQGWISVNQETNKCPECGRKYIGREKLDDNGCTIIYAEEITR